MDTLNSCFVIGESRTNADNAITKIYNSFYMAFEIDDKSGCIIGFDCTHTLEATNIFLQKLFIGKNFLGVEQWLEEELNYRYGGSSRKAIIVSYRDAVKRYRAMRSIK